jgi:cation transport regulator
VNLSKTSLAGTTSPALERVCKAITGVRRINEALDKEDEPVPYEELDDLPDSVKRNLPKHAREIYRAAYNSAEDQYDEESRAHRVAWSAVEQKYEKNENGEWVEK